MTGFDALLFKQIFQPLRFEDNPQRSDLGEPYGVAESEPLGTASFYDPPMEAVRVQDVSKTVGRRPNRTVVFDQLNFSLPRNRYVGILGKPGSGKSTLLRLIAGNMQADTGRITRAVTMSWPIASREVFKKDMTIRSNIRFITQMYGADFKDLLDATIEIGRLQRDDIDKTLREVPDEVHSHAVVSLCYALNFECYLADERLSLGTVQFRERMWDMFNARRPAQMFIITSGNLRLIRERCEVLFVIENKGLSSFPTKGDAVRAFKGLTRGEMIIDDILEQPLFSSGEAN